MKRYKSLIRTIIVVGVLSVPLYFAACDAGGGVAAPLADACETNNTAEVTVVNNQGDASSIYLNGTYLFTIQAGQSKTTNVPAGSQVVIKYLVNSLDKCIHTRTFTKCQKITLTCPVD